MRKSGLLLSALCLLSISPTYGREALPLPEDAPVPGLPTVHPEAGNPIDTPITGATVAPEIPDMPRPPSLEAAMAIRPGYAPRVEESTGRDQAVRLAAWSFGARGGEAARAFAINDMLGRYAAVLDRTYDFRTLVLPAGDGATLIRPPVVTEAEMAIALDSSGQSARETRQIYQITRKAALVSVPPQWRTWLVRDVNIPPPPAEPLRPRTRHEVEVWRVGVAEGWAKGERQAVEVFLDDLARLERDLVGMARYRTLLAAGKVEAPEVAFLHRDTQGGHDMMRVDDTEIRIRAQPGLDADRAHWRGQEDLP
ncbi:type IV secretory system conjugative DNA transfer family protein [Gluconacetobacter diazotrophicus]|uniref:Type IV secretory system conjugative DNA transfer family protein n=1 Tax=Gluconacetobacter diazotrophicus TaxID=33996 RepID=A0A7W4FF58_GLUDI|nr:type IV secretory system conjugative DNA transfer family protein [Gluconacetobacter diazotrophicus]MBB2156613.1 type IV secretory system conjugative DNA transfer family protein [Gluconacetobacter diazotrophicus]